MMMRYISPFTATGEKDKWQKFVSFRCFYFMSWIFYKLNLGIGFCSVGKQSNTDKWLRSNGLGLFV